MEHQRAHAPTLHRGGCRRGYHAASPPREPATPYPEHLRDLVEDYLEDLDFSGTGDGADASATAGLVEAMRHSLLAGGKRIRPVLALAACEGLGRPARTLLPAAAAIELVHTYSLIHDDLPAMDDDDLRRGRPTCHRAFGEDTAILAGDALFAEAIRLVAERQPGGPAVRLAILREISRAAGLGGMVGGQFLDLTDAARSSPAALARMHALKTGRLISCAVECALAVADPAPDTARGLRGYARELGLLFQIVDDILDVEGTAVVLGKSVGADARRGKVTYVSTHGLGGARRLAGEAHVRALAALEGLDGDFGDLAEIADLTFVRRN